MDRLFKNKYIFFSVRFILGAIFIYASLDKIANPEAFAKIIENYRILPIQLVNPLAIYLPWVELLIGLFLIIDKWLKPSLLIYNILLIIFIITLSQALIRGLDIACGCFSVKPSSTSDIWLRIIEDFILLFFGFMLFKYSDEYNSEINSINNHTQN